MIVIRESTLPKLDITQIDRHLKERDEYKDRPKWQHMPQLIAKKDTFKHILLSFKSNNEENQTKYLKSRYNIYKKYPNGESVLMNTASEAVVLMSKNETSVYENTTEVKETSEFIDALIQFGIIVRQEVDEKFQIDIMRNQIAYTNPDSINIMILPTLDCNARCYYCFQQNEKKETMTEKTADEIVAFITKTLSTKYELNYRWFGGEPLMAYNVIDKIIKGVNTAFNGKLKYNSVIFTNNSLITEKMLDTNFCDWHVHKVHTTLDGYGIENNNRKSFVDNNIDAYKLSIENIRKILKRGYFVVCRIHFDKMNIDQFDNILNDLIEFKDNNNFYIFPTTLRNMCHSEEEAQKIYIYPDEYKIYYSQILSRLFEKEFYKDAIKILPFRLRNFCLAYSMGSLVINSDGKFYRCEQHSFDEDNCVGNYETGIMYNKAYKKWFQQMNALPYECQECVFLPCCQGGCRHYRMENKPEASPCLREKYYIEEILDIIYNKFTAENTFAQEETK